MSAILQIIVTFVVTLIKLIITTIVALVTAVVNLLKGFVPDEAKEAFIEGFNDVRDEVAAATKSKPNDDENVTAEVMEIAS